MPICIFNILYAYLYVFNMYLICRYGVSILGPIRIEQPCRCVTSPAMPIWTPACAPSTRATACRIQYYYQETLEIPESARLPAPLILVLLIVDPVPATHTPFQPLIGHISYRLHTCARSFMSTMIYGQWGDLSQFETDNASNVFAGCQNQEIGWPFLFKGHKIGTCSSFGADSATNKKTAALGASLVCCNQ
jgi:hypothetical protein